MSEFDSFVDGLNGEEEQFDVSNDLHAPEESSGPAGDAPEVITAPKDDSRWRQMRKELRETKQKLASLESRPEPQFDFSDSDEIPAEYLQLYGDTEETRKGYPMFKRLLDNAAQRGKQEALSEFASREEQEGRAAQEYSNLIDEQLENLEEAHGVDLTSNTPAARKARIEYLSLVQRLSPKDAEGNVESYADFDEVWDIYSSQKKDSGNTAVRKELAARGMQKSSPAPTEADGYKGGGFNAIRSQLGL